MGGHVEDKCMSLGETVGELWVKIGLDAAELQFGLDKAKYALTEWRDKTNENTRDLARWGAAISAQAAPLIAYAGAVYKATEKYGQMANELKDLSYQTKISTDRLQQLQYAAVLAGANFDKIAVGLTQLTQSMADTSDTSSKAYKAFMGLEVDPRGRTPEEVFDQTARALVGMESVTLRNQYAMDLYGKSWKDMLPYMETYIENAKEIREHPWMTEQELNELEEAKIEFDKIGSKVTTLAGKVLALSRAWDEGIGSDFWKDIKKADDAMGPLVISFGDAAIKAQTLADKIKNARRELEDLQQAIMDATLSRQATGMEQRDTLDEYNALLAERKLIELQADPNTSGGIAYMERLKGIDRRLAELSLRYNQNNQSLIKDRRTIDRGNEDLKGGTTVSDFINKAESIINQTINIINPSGTPQQNAAAVKQAARDLAREL